MTRLPTPGGDDGQWGTILNDFLSQAHNADGSLKQLSQSQIQNLVSDLAGKVNTADLRPVATSGSYADLTDKPSIPATAADVGAVSAMGLDAATAALVNNGTSTTAGALKAAYGPQVGSVRVAADKPGLYFADHLRRWRTKVANANYKRAKIGVYGHSIVAGGYANDDGGGQTVSDEATWRQRSFVAQLRQRFATQYGDPGEGFFWPGDTSGQIFTVSGDASKEGPHDSFGYAGFRLNINAGSAGLVTVNTPQCTDITMWVKGNGFGGVQYTIDGSAAVSAAVQSADIYPVTISGLTDTSHTLTMTGQGTSRVYIVGVEFIRNPTKGVAVHRFGYSGMCEADAFVEADPGRWGGGSWTTTQAGRDAQMNSVTAAIGIDLAILMYDVNDTSRGFSTYNLQPADVQNNIQRLCDRLVANGMDVLLLCGPPKDPTSYTSPALSEYSKAYYNVAYATDRVAYLDITQIWPSWIDSKNIEGLSHDYVHPNLRGHSDIARILYSAIG